MYARSLLINDGPRGIARRFTRLPDELDRAFGLRCGGGFVAYPPVNIWMKGDELVVEAEIPGVDQKDIEADVTGNTLTISGERKQETEHENGEVRHRCERRFGSFSRAIELPFRVEPEKISAVCRNGVLRISLQRAEQDKAKKINISAE